MNRNSQYISTEGIGKDLLMKMSDHEIIYIILLKQYDQIDKGILNNPISSRLCKIIHKMKKFRTTDCIIFIPIELFHVVSDTQNFEERSLSV